MKMGIFMLVLRQILKVSMNLIFFKGFFVSFSLIMAIGAQNAFIIKQALKRRYVFLICSVCFISDIFLISLGIFGFSELIAKNKFFSLALAVCGIAFCLFYAFVSFKQALSVKQIKQDDISLKEEKLKKILLLCLAFTYLNPHAYLDTIFLIGAVSLHFNFNEKIYFALGAFCASFLWFFSLGYGVKFLSVYMTNPKFLKLIDFLTGIIMLCVAYSLLVYLKPYL